MSFDEYYEEQNDIGDYCGNLLQFVAIIGLTLVLWSVASIAGMIALFAFCSCPVYSFCCWVCRRVRIYREKRERRAA